MSRTVKDVPWSLNSKEGSHINSNLETQTKDFTVWEISGPQSRRSGSQITFIILLTPEICMDLGHTQEK